jgi:AcrR family transcriptional regulator
VLSLRQPDDPKNCTGLLALRPRLTTGLPLSASPLVERRKNANQGVQFTQGPNVSSHLLTISFCIILAAMSVRDQLLDAAAKLYAEAGYRGATTRRIAEGAGVNEITLFRHFGSKDALIREAITRAAGSSTVSPTLPDSPRDPARELGEWAKAHITELRERRALIRTCMGEIEEHPGIFSHENSPPALAAKSLARYLRRLKESGMAKAPFNEAIASTMLMGALFADAMGRDVMPDLYRNEPGQALDEYVQLFLRSIGVGRRRNVSA